MDEKETKNPKQKRNKEKKPIEEYLHCIDVDKVLFELGLDMNGLCNMLKLDYQTINRWSWTKSKKGNRPTYNATIRMLQKGATVETLFGVEYKRKEEFTVPSKFDSPEFKQGVARAIEDLKKMGVIR